MYTYENNPVNIKDLIKVRCDNVIAFVDSSGNQILPFKYTDFKDYDYSEGLAPVGFNGKWGYVDEYGKEVIPLIYDFALEFRNGIALVKQKQKQFFINKNNQIVSKLYSKISILKNGYSSGTIGNGNSYLLDSTGKVILPHIYQSIRSLNDKLLIEQENKYGLLNLDLGLFAKPTYDDIKDFKNGFAYKTGNKWGLLNKNGERATDAIYDDVFKYAENYMVVNVNKKWMLVDSLGDQISKESFEKVSTYSRYTQIYRNGKWGLSDTLGNILIKPQYDKIKTPDKDNLCFVKNGNFKEYVTLQNEKVFTKNQYIELQKLYNDLIIFKMYDKYGVMDINENIIIPDTYDGIMSAGENLLEARIGNKYGLLNAKGEQLTKVKYDRLYIGSFEYGAYKKGNKFGIMNRMGKELTSNIFDSVRGSFDLFVEVKKDDHSFIVDHRGKCVANCDNKAKELGGESSYGSGKIYYIK